MTSPDIISLRQENQKLVQSTFEKPTDVLSWMCAMQAQEYAMAKWSIGLRLKGSKDADIEKNFNEGSILRTHLMRPTWHFVTPLDIRWMLELTASRVMVVNAFTYRECELDSKIFKKSNDIIVKALEGGKQLTRDKLKSALEKGKIFADGIRLSCFMMQAELDGIICSGARQGNQFSYALLDEWVPPVKKLHRKEALEALSIRYFTSRGPATIPDFVTWSGLTVKDAKEGIAMIGSGLIKEMIDGREYFLTPYALKNKYNSKLTFLMPDYDEYGMGYKDRSAMFNPRIKVPEIGIRQFPYNRMVILDGRIAGAWKRDIAKDRVIIQIDLFTQLSKPAHQKILSAAKKYADFLGMKAEILI